MWVPLLEGAGTGLTKFRWYRVVVPGGVAAFKRSEREKGSEEETTCKQRSGLFGVVSDPWRPKVALVSNFLKQLGKQTGNCGKYARLWNKTLEEDGFEVLFERLRFKAGSKPWVGTRGLFKEVRKWL